MRAQSTGPWRCSIAASLSAAEFGRQEVSSMIADVFVDANILIYAHDSEAGAKHAVAGREVKALWEARRGVVSIQVLQEFYVNVTRKIARPIHRADAREVIDAYRAWTVVEVGADDVLRASGIEERNKISFWDAMIVSAAVKAGATTILSEDLNAGQAIEGIEIVNPFATLRPLPRERRR